MNILFQIYIKFDYVYNIKFDFRFRNKIGAEQKIFALGWRPQSGEVIFLRKSLFSVHSRYGRWI